jgi:translocation and assembly module TamB
MTTRKRGLLWIAIGLGATMLLLVAVAAVVSQTAWFRGWLRDQAVERLSSQWQGDLAIGALEGNLFTGLSLRDVRLVLDGRTVASIDELRASYNLWAMITDELSLDELRLRGLELRLVERNGTWNVADALAATEPEPASREPASTRFGIDRLVVSDATVRVRRPGDRRTIRDAELVGSIAVAPDETTLTLESASLRLPRSHVRVRELAGTVAYAAAGAIDVTNLRLRTDRSHVTGDVAFDPDERVDVAVEAALDAGELRRLARTDVPRQDVHAKVAAHGPARAVTVDATLAAGDATIDLDGTLDLAAEPEHYDLTARFGHVDLAALLGPEQPATDVNGSVRVTGSGTDLGTMTTSVAATLADSTVAGTRLAKLGAEARIDAGAVRFEADANAPAGNAHATGTVAPAAERYDVTVEARDFDPATLTGNARLRGSLNATLQVHGKGFTPATADAEASLAVAPSRIGDLAITSADADVAAQGGRLDVRRLTVESPALAAQASGTIGLEATTATATTGDLRFDVQARDLGALGAVAGAPDAKGTLTLTGTASGNLEAFTVDADVHGRELGYGGARIGRLTADVDATRVGADDGRATVTAAADDVAAGGRDLAHAELTATWRQTGAATSTATVDLAARDRDGRRDAFVASAEIGPDTTRVAVDTLVLALGEDTWRAVGRPVVTVAASAIGVEDLELRSDRGVVRAAGVARRSGASDLRVHVEGVELGPLFAEDGESAPDRIAGTLAVDATLTGTLGAPRLVGDATIARPRLGGVPYAEARAHLETTPTSARVEATLAQQPGQALVLRATAPVTLSLAPFEAKAQGTIDGSLTADRIDLAFLSAMTTQVADPGGTLTADVRIAGTLDQPLVRGPVTIAGGHARLPAIGVTYDDVELALRLEGQAATVERLHVAAGDGTIDGRGNVRIEPSGPALDVRIELTRFPLFDNKDGHAAASGWLWASGTLAAPVLEGSIETEELVFQIPETLPGQVRPPDPTIEVVGPDAPVAPQAVAATQREDAAAPTPSVLDRAAITVQVQVPRNAWIKRSDAEIELRGWITAWKKPDEELQLSGVIEVVRGWFSFQGKTFDVTEGEVTFTGQGLAPNLHLVAEHRAGEYTVRVVLGGTVTKPKLTLESDPTLSQADILSVLIFGKPASELSSGQSAGLREQALGVAAGYAASELRQSVANALGVDTLEFNTGGGSLEQASISAGKYVAPDLFVSLAHRFGEAVEELRIEYFLTPHWTIETSTDTRGRSGADVFWKLRY